MEYTLHNSRLSEIFQKINSDLNIHQISNIFHLTRELSLTKWEVQSNASCGRPRCIKHRILPSSISFHSALLLFDNNSVQTMYIVTNI